MAVTMIDRMRASAVMALVVWLAAAQAAAAQQNPVDCADADGTAPRHLNDTSLAYLYAPELHFAPQERYFPILPFYNAFLQLPDSPGDTLTPDLAGEVAIPKNGDTLVVWDWLARDYDSLQVREQKRRERKSVTLAEKVESLHTMAERYKDSLATQAVIQQVLQETLSDQRQAALQLFGAEYVPPVAALFYRVDHLNRRESNGIWKRVRTDFQLWQRLNLSDHLRHLAVVDSLPLLISLEYYAYYIRDLGLTGHAQDLEKFFVFIPEDCTPVEIMVGAAHSVVTPNNVAVITRKQQQEYIYPTSALVEYGGHSFSPDVPPLGPFTPGWDINWRSSERSWGVRDIQAILGTGFSGDYRTQYTLPRSDSIGVTLTPLSPERALKDSASTPTSNRGYYALIPIAPYRELFDALALNGGTVGSRVRGVRAAWTALKPKLEQRMWPMRSFPDDSAAAEQVYHRMRLWLKDLGKEDDAEEPVPGRPKTVSPLKGSGSKMRPWQAKEYMQSPEHIMKAWLYRPQDPARSCKLLQYTPIHLQDVPYFEVGARYGIGKTKSHTGVSLEIIDAYHCIERGTKLSIPGTLGFGVVLSPFNIDQGPVELQLRYQQRYFSPQSITWSVGLSYVASYDSAETAEVLRESSERSRFRLRPALSIMPLGLLFGAKMEPNWINLVLSSVAFRVGPQFDLFHPSRSMAWQMELAIRPIPKFRPRGRRASEGASRAAPATPTQVPVTTTNEAPR
jgi:hypothetical protein